MLPYRTKDRGFTQEEGQHKSFIHILFSHNPSAAPALVVNAGMFHNSGAVWPIVATDEKSTTKKGRPIRFPVYFLSFEIIDHMLSRV